VIDADTGHLIKDLVETGETFVILKGGRGGQGNTKFKTSTHRTPRFAQPGEPGETRTLKLELKLLNCWPMSALSVFPMPENPL